MRVHRQPRQDDGLLTTGGGVSGLSGAVALPGHRPQPGPADAVGAPGGLGPDGRSVSCQLVQRAVPGDAPGDQDLARQPGDVGKEARCPLVVDGAVPRHVQQRRHRGPSGRDHEQVAADLRAVGDLD